MPICPYVLKIHYHFLIDHIHHFNESANLPERKWSPSIFQNMATEIWQDDLLSHFAQASWSQQNYTTRVKPPIDSSSALPHFMTSRHCPSIPPACLLVAACPVGKLRFAFLGVMWSTAVQKHQLVEAQTSIFQHWLRHVNSIYWSMTILIFDGDLL